MFAELNHGIKLHVPLLNIPIDKEMNDAKSAIIITLNISILYLIHNVKCVYDLCHKRNAIHIVCAFVCVGKLSLNGAQNKCISPEYPGK